MLVAMLHFVPDEAQPRRIVDTLLDALPSGSYLVASHVTAEHDPDTLAGAGRAYQERGLTGQIRTADEFAELAFRGLEMVEPGLVLVSEWRPVGTGPRPMPIGGQRLRRRRPQALAWPWPCLSRPVRHSRLTLPPAGPQG